MVRCASGRRTGVSFSLPSYEEVVRDVIPSFMCRRYLGLQGSAYEIQFRPAGRLADTIARSRGPWSPLVSRAWIGVLIL